jgi:hypothetical protein
MPRRPRDDSQENSETGPESNSGRNGSEPEASDIGEEREGDDQIVLDGNEQMDEVPEPASENLMDPKPHKTQRERRMAAEGNLPNQKVMVKRLSPDRVVNPSTGLAIRCEGQYKVWKGQLTRDEIEEMVHQYFGGGIMRVVQQNDDMTNSKDFGKMMGRFNLTFPGEPNMQNVIADCSTSAPVPVSVPTGGVPSLPIAADDPAAKIAREAAVLEAEKRKMEKELEFDEARLENDRKRRAMKRRAELQQRVEEDGEDFAFDGPPGSRMPVPFRPGLGFPGRHGPPLPFDEMNQPLSLKDQIHQSEIDRVKEEARRVAERLERMSEESRKPKTDMKEMIVALGTVLGPVIVKMLDISNQNAAAARESQNQFNRLMAENANKQLEMFTNVIGIKDNRENNNFEHMVKLIELGKDMGGGEDGEGGGTVIEQIGRAGGDLIGGIVEALQRGKQQPAPVMMPHPQALPVIKPSAVPHPGASLAGYPHPALPPPPAPTAAPAINPAQVVHAPPAAQQVQTPEPTGQTEAGEPPMDDKQLKAIARAIVQAALEEIDTKPAESKWVLVAFKNLPDNWIEAIANANSYTELTEMAKPYAPMDLLFLKFLPKFQGDPGVKPWLETGWAELREMCLEEMKSGVTQAEGRSAEDAETEFGGENP